MIRLCNLMLILIMCPFFVGAQTIIKGKINGLNLGTIRVVAYQDFITYKTIDLCESTIDSLGNFELVFKVPTATFCVLESSKQAGIYIEPEKTYSVVLSTTDSLSDEFDLEYIHPENEEDSKSNINPLISKFNQDYDEFVERNINLFVKKTAKHAVDSFCDLSNKKYSKVVSPYFQNYTRYSLANLKFAASYGDKKQVYNNYLQNCPVLYFHDL